MEFRHCSKCLAHPPYPVYNYSRGTRKLFFHSSNSGALMIQPHTLLSATMKPALLVEALHQQTLLLHKHIRSRFLTPPESGVIAATNTQTWT